MNRREDKVMDVPKGWRLVPIEPTEAMIAAGGDGIFDCYRGYNDETIEHMRLMARATNERSACRAWAPMLAAAPEPPK